MRVAAQRDKNEDAIVEALEAHGIRVRKVSDGGLMDLITWRGYIPDENVKLIEVKTEHGRLRPRQKMWALIALPVHIARTPEQALAVWGITSTSMVRWGVFVSKGKPKKLPPPPPSAADMYTVPAAGVEARLTGHWPLTWGEFCLIAEDEGWPIGEVGAHGLPMGSIVSQTLKRDGQGVDFVFEEMGPGSMVFRRSLDRRWDRALLYRDCR